FVVKPDGKLLAPPTCKVPVLATVRVPVPDTVKVPVVRVELTVRLFREAVLTSTVTGAPLAITTLLPATGTLPRSHVAGVFQLPPAPVDVYVGVITALRLIAV